jgi:hypothetical protein
VRRRKYCTRNKEEADEPLKRKETRKVRDTPLLEGIESLAHSTRPSSLPRCFLAADSNESLLFLRLSQGGRPDPVVGEV